MQWNLRLNSRFVLKALSITLFSALIGTLLGSSTKGALAQGSGGGQQSGQTSQPTCTVVEPGTGTLQDAIDAAKKYGVHCLQLKEGEYSGDVSITDQIVEIQGVPFSVSPKSIIKGGLQVSWGKSFAKGSAPDSVVALMRVQLSEGDSMSGNDVLLSGYSRVYLVNTTISELDGISIIVRGSSVIELASSSVSQCEIGIDTSDFSTVILRDSSVIFNKDAGIVASGSSTVKLFNSHVDDNGYGGISVHDSSTVTLAGSSVGGNSFEGIEAFDSSTVTLFNSEVNDNGTNEECQRSGRIVCGGVLVHDTAKVVFVGGRVAINSRWGIAVSLRKCGFNDDTFHGVLTPSTKEGFKKDKDGRVIEVCGDQDINSHTVSDCTKPETWPAEGKNELGGDLCLPDTTK